VHDIRLLGADEPPQPREQRQFVKRIEAAALEVAVELLIEPSHARQFPLRRPPRRWLAQPTIAQSLPTLFVVTLDQSLNGGRRPERLAGKLIP